MTEYKVGLLPFYLELYDVASPEVRPHIDEIYTQITGKLRESGIDLICAPVCRVKEEFNAAVELFELEDVCAVITLHLAYSPSLQSIDALCRIQVPIIVLDTTEAYAFDSSTSPDEIMYNHGIHGVQDMCNLLLRRGKKFYMEAGHFEHSDVIARVSTLCRAAVAAARMRHAKVGIVGQPFEGMGDFIVPFDELKRTLGLTVIEFSQADRKLYPGLVTQTDIEAEMEEDLRRFDGAGVNKEANARTTKAGLMLRRWIEDKELTAFTVNFMAIIRDSGFDCMPFLEACKQMASGVGYAGEGDVLTAALVGALASVYPSTTFTEMFCPDWRGNSIFLSHMGEMNINSTAEKPRLVEKDFPYTEAMNPVVAYGRYKPGKAVLVNLAPMAGGRYCLLLCAVEVLDVEGEDRMADSIHGWFRPGLPIASFLKQYSMAGGTHHLAMVYGDVLEELIPFGQMLGFDVKII
jgi:L-arabinose isomerase